MPGSMVLMAEPPHVEPAVWIVAVVVRLPDVPTSFAGPASQFARSEGLGHGRVGKGLEVVCVILHAAESIRLCRKAQGFPLQLCH